MWLRDGVPFEDEGTSIMRLSARNAVERVTNSMIGGGGGGKTVWRRRGSSGRRRGCGGVRLAMGHTGWARRGVSLSDGVVSTVASVAVTAI
jgi:hypothetical protein